MARKVAPALGAGCTCVIKSAGETPFSANALAKLGEEAGVPKGVINIVTALENTAEIGLTLCSSEIVRKISFTGSTRVGKLLMKQSSDTLKKLSLELGGNAAFIIYDDADLQEAVTGVLASKFKVSGQTCVSANRIFVQDKVYDKFCGLLKEAVSKLKVGHGFDKSTTQGPLTAENSIAKVTEHVDDAVKKGATVVVGGEQLTSLGKYLVMSTIHPLEHMLSILHPHRTQLLCSYYTRRHAR